MGYGSVRIRHPGGYGGRGLSMYEEDGAGLDQPGLSVHARHQQRHRRTGPGQLLPRRNTGTGTDPVWPVA